MRGQEKIKDKIRKSELIELSSIFTKIGSYIGVFIALFTIVIIIAIISKELSRSSYLLLLLVLSLSLILLIFNVFKLFYIARAELKGDVLCLKKVMGNDYVINVNCIIKIYSFKLNQTTYTYINFKNKNKRKKVLILNSRWLQIGNGINAGDIIKLAISINKLDDSKSASKTIRIR